MGPAHGDGNSPMTHTDLCASLAAVWQCGNSGIREGPPVLTEGNRGSVQIVQTMPFALKSRFCSETLNICCMVGKD